MADRVAIIGGSTVGRDHFPAPTVAADLSGTGYHYGARTPFQFVVDTDDFMNWFYRVRKWNFVCTLSLTYNNGVDPPVSGIEVEIDTSPMIAKVFASLEDVIDGIDGVVPARESDLVLPKLGIDFDFEGHCGIAPDSITEDWTALPNGATSNTSTDVDIFVELALGLQFGIPYWQDGLRAQVRFDVSVRDFDNEEVGQDALVDTQESEGLREVGSFVINSSFGGSTLFTLPIETPDNARRFTVDSAEAILEPLISVDAYWPYATTAGAPVYDTSTGGILNDPLS